MKAATIEPVPALADLSASDRFGIKGRAAESWLKSVGIDVPTRPNRLIHRDDGLVVARLGDADFAFADFGRPVSPELARLREALEHALPEGCFSVPRADSQVAFSLMGEAVTEVLSAVCPADLRARCFGRGDVLQTRCAGVSALLWNLSRDVLRIVVLCDSSVARHQWTALQGAIISVSHGLDPLYMTGGQDEHENKSNAKRQAR